MRAVRGGLGLAGMGMIAYGVWQIFAFRQATHPTELGKWLIAALVLHDGVLAWVVVAAGWLVARLVPRRARPYVQGGLACAALVTLIALPLIYRRGKSAPGSALLTQNYAAHLGLLLGIVVAVAVAGYVVRVLREHTHARNSAKDRPSADHTSSTV